ncbi:MAG: MiaB/RimO family radical SAM methylthiotransferase [Desulfovibrio sp.]|jgi:MiaB/RimO family radical SAM methylthiotransferase|nr:MiaB/RimO family radical SAM methylthiotransferase [Desulfovibrio sp.]
MKRQPQGDEPSFWKFYIVTFGCKVNQYESQALREAWENIGGTECENPGEAEVICINSCAVTARGERDARNAVFRLKRAAPSARLILTGCATQFFTSHKARKGSIQAVPDILLPQEKKPLLLADPRALPPSPPDMPDAALRASFPPFQITAFKRARPVIKVQDGCTHRCTYCVVPYTRGPATSRPPPEILAEARRLLKAGYAEIILSGVNLHQYGRDNLNFGDFWDLLNTLEAALAAEFAGKARFRISSLTPPQLTQRGLDCLAASRMVCPHLHLSLQHASPAVLKRMGRGHYSARSVADAVTMLGRIWPVMGLGADILVGFPGETDEDIALLTDFVRTLPFSYAHVFPWSSRPGTPAAGFDGQLPMAVRRARASRVREVVAQRRATFFRKQLSLKRMLVVVDSPETTPARMKGLNEFYAPCVFEREINETCGLISARPVALADKELLVEII